MGNDSSFTRKRSAGSGVFLAVLAELARKAGEAECEGVPILKEGYLMKLLKGGVFSERAAQRFQEPLTSNWPVWSAERRQRFIEQLRRLIEHSSVPLPWFNEFLISLFNNEENRTGSRLLGCMQEAVRSAPAAAESILRYCRHILTSRWQKRFTFFAMDIMTCAARASREEAHDYVNFITSLPQEGRSFRWNILNPIFRSLREVVESQPECAPQVLKYMETFLHDDVGPEVDDILRTLSVVGSTVRDCEDKAYSLIMEQLSSPDERVQNCAVQWITEMALTLPHRAAEVFDVLTGLPLVDTGHGTAACVCLALCRICISTSPQKRRAVEYLTMKIPIFLQSFDETHTRSEKLYVLLGKAAQTWPGIADSLASLYEVHASEGTKKLPIEPLSHLSGISSAVALRTLPFIVRTTLRGDHYESNFALSILSDLVKRFPPVKSHLDSLLEAEMEKEYALTQREGKS